jgi:hypothetical protein
MDPTTFCVFGINLFWTYARISNRHICKKRKNIFVLVSITWSNVHLLTRTYKIQLQFRLVSPLNVRISIQKLSRKQVFRLFNILKRQDVWKWNLSYLYIKVVKFNWNSTRNYAKMQENVENYNMWFHFCVFIHKNFVFSGIFFQELIISTRHICFSNFSRQKQGYFLRTE